VGQWQRSGGVERREDVATCDRERNVAFSNDLEPGAMILLQEQMPRKTGVSLTIAGTNEFSTLRYIFHRSSHIISYQSSLAPGAD
jgi:hypothetical protein